MEMKNGILIILTMLFLLYQRNTIIISPISPNQQIDNTRKNVEVPKNGVNAKNITIQDEGQRGIIKDLPLCQHLNMTQNYKRVKNLDEIIENCTIEEGYSVYDNIGRGGTLPQLHILKNTITHAREPASSKSQVCYSHLTDINTLPDNDYRDFIAFIEKHNLREKSLLAIAFPYPIVDFYSYSCQDVPVCDSLLKATGGENESHYYVLGTIDYKYTGNPVINIDDRLYWLGKYKELKNTGLVEEGIRTVTSLSGDILMVSKFTENKIVNEPRLLEKEEKRSRLSKFKIKHCEINLRKIPLS